MYVSLYDAILTLQILPFSCGDAAASIARYDGGGIRQHMRGGLPDDRPYGDRAGRGRR